MNRRLSPAIGRHGRLLFLLPGVLAAAGCLEFEQARQAYCHRQPDICGDRSSTDAGDAGLPDSGTGTAPPSAEAGSVDTVSSSGAHNLALRANSTVWTWGRNDQGQLGDGTTVERYQPLAVPGVSNVRKVAAGFVYSLALDRTARVWFWGKGDLLGNAPLAPVVIPDLENIVDISAGGAQAYAVRQNGPVYFWGIDHPQLGRVSLTPIEVPGLQDIQTLSAGTSHALALDGQDRVWAVGLNDKGQLGITGKTYSASAVLVPNLPSMKFIAAGARHSLAVDFDGRVWAWGENDTGQLGDGTKGNFRAEPRVVPMPTPVQRVAAGHDHSLALTQGREVWAWGNDDHGQLGNDSLKQEQLRPVRTRSLTDVQSIAAGFRHSLAVNTQGLLFAWGSNEDGQLGLEVKEDVPVPTLPVSLLP